MEGERRFTGPLLAACALAAGARALLLGEYLAENPFARLPYGDGQLYWDWAGELSAGAWRPDTPFLIAPLFAYFLAAVRVVGFDLAGLYVLQMALHLATAVLVGAAARTRGGDAAGWIAAGLFLLLAEPALFATRVLSVTLQVFLAALLWWDAARLAAAGAPRPLHAARVGVWLGLLVLAFPAALVLIPAYAAWLAWQVRTRGGTTSTRWAPVAAGTGAALLLVSPATLHNWSRSGEWIPVTSHAGVTLAHGNGPGSIGIYTPLDDVSHDVHQQHEDAARAFERAVGRAGTWTEVDAHFKARVFAWWRAHPLEALALFARKGLWFVASRDYDNVASFSLEREHGLLRRAVLTPLELPWLMGAALLGLAILARQRRGFVEAGLVAVPLLVCVGFHYSARYRLVAAPVLCGLVALAAVRWRELPGPRSAAAALALLPLPLLVATSSAGFGRLDFMREDFARTLSDLHVRAAGLRASEPQAQRLHLERAVAASPNNVGARRRLHDALVAAGDCADTRANLQALDALTPRDARTQLALGWLFASCPTGAPRDTDAAAAARHARAALELSEGPNPEALLLLAMAEAERGELRQARAAVDRGAEQARAAGDERQQQEFERLRARLAGSGAGPGETPP